MTTGQPHTEPLDTLGVCLDPLGVQLALPDGEPTVLDLPPSALLPARPGEPVRADVRVPPHVRGSGVSWPPEARLTEGRCGRFPIAFAWPRLVQDADEPWRWHPPPAAGATVTGSQEMSPPEALAATLAAARLSTDGHSRSVPGPTALIIPDVLGEAQQDRLLRAINEQGLAAQLLWRPIAGAITWCRRNEQRLHEGRPWLSTMPDGEVATARPIGRLLTLHFGLDSLEAALLSVVASAADDRWCLMPARHRPHRQHTVTPGLWRAAVNVFDRCFGAEEKNWTRMWCRSAFGRLIRSLSEPPQSDAERHLQRMWEESLDDASASRSDMFTVHRSAADSNPIQVMHRWLTSVRAAARTLPDTEPVLGVLCTGPFARTRYRGESLAHEGVSRIRTPPPSRSLPCPRPRTGTPHHQLAPIRRPAGPRLLALHRRHIMATESPAVRSCADGGVLLSFAGSRCAFSSGWVSLASSLASLCSYHITEPHGSGPTGTAKANRVPSVTGSQPK